MRISTKKLSDELRINLSPPRLHRWLNAVMPTSHSEEEVWRQICVFNPSSYGTEILITGPSFPVLCSGIHFYPASFLGRPCDQPDTPPWTHPGPDYMERISTLSIAELVHPRLGKILESTRWLSTEAETCLNLIPREWKVFSADTMINLEELQSAIRHTKKNTSAGCCGWTQPD